MSNVNQSMHNTTNLQKQLLEMSAAVASMSSAKEESKSKKGRNQSRQPTYPSNNKPSHQYQPTSRAKDTYEMSSYSQPKQSDNLPGYPSNSSLLGVRLPPDTEIIKYTSGSKKSCKCSSRPSRLLNVTTSLLQYS